MCFRANVNMILNPSTNDPRPGWIPLVPSKDGRQLVTSRSIARFWVVKKLWFLFQCDCVGSAISYHHPPPESGVVFHDGVFWGSCHPHQWALICGRTPGLSNLLHRYHHVSPTTFTVCPTQWCGIAGCSGPCLNLVHFSRIPPHAHQFNSIMFWVTSWESNQIVCVVTVYVLWCRVGIILISCLNYCDAACECFSIVSTYSTVQREVRRCTQYSYGSPQP